MKLYLFFDDEEWTFYGFYCPGCKYTHTFRVKAPEPPVWDWNGDLEKPTFTPSLLCNKDYPESRCHLFVRDGKIEFLNDCHHELKGQTVEIPEWK